MIRYIFENKLNSNVAIVIRAYNAREALELLRSTTDHSEDFKLKN